MFETGVLDLDAASLKRVMTISSGESLYIATQLLDDPASFRPANGVRKVIGNVGRAGLAFLIPPRDPRTRDRDPEKWSAINHEPFDGHLIDRFERTTLHLGFSGYELPLTAGEHGNQFLDAFFIETMVSVHDREEWVADIDILSAFRSCRMLNPMAQPSCQSDTRGKRPPFHLSSMDSWDEVLDRPNHRSVIRAQGNWQARLAAIAINNQADVLTIIFKGAVCWDCGSKALEKTAKDETLGNKVTSAVFII